MIHGAEKMAADPNAMKMLFNMADKALFTEEPNPILNNSLGALFLMTIFQVFKGTDVLNPYFEVILDRTLKRFTDEKSEKQGNLLRKSLLQVFLSAAIYNSNATIRFLTMRKATKDILLQIFKF
mmetsp:Transcript_24382/g.37788  ORF Transcript_24382/g.37788 Transcript_24382/m.37788 type:complete len:124 (-) Transcript_24382:688-1059(-)